MAPRHPNRFLLPRQLIVDSTRCDPARYVWLNCGATPSAPSFIGCCRTNDCVRCALEETLHVTEADLKNPSAPARVASPTTPSSSSPSPPSTNKTVTNENSATLITTVATSATSLPAAESTPPPPVASPTGGTPATLIGIIGGVVIFLLAAACFMLYRRRVKKQAIARKLFGYDLITGMPMSPPPEYSSPTSPRAKSGFFKRFLKGKHEGAVRGLRVMEIAGREVALVGEADGREVVEMGDSVGDGPRGVELEGDDGEAVVRELEAGVDGLWKQEAEGEAKEEKVESPT